MTIVARFNHCEFASSSATLMTAGASDGATFTVEHDVATETFVVVRHEAAEAAAPEPMTIEEFAAGLSEKFDAHRKEHYPMLEKEPVTYTSGRKFYKVVKGGGVHCFVEKATGHVYKAAGWNAPAKGVRFTTMEAALEAADPYGGYLYK